MPRKTRWSIIQGELLPPYEVEYGYSNVNETIHSFGRVIGGNSWDSCCRIQLAGITRITAEAPNCVACALCKGCHVCQPGHICDATMNMGKWETKDKRKLYPFEMDSTHLMNAIAKLNREKFHFKDNWEAWVRALRAEAALRKLL